MAGELIITVSGLRGIVGENLTPAVAADYGRAFASFLREKAAHDDKLSVCLGRDSRPSGQSLAQAVTSGLAAFGIDVIDLGIVTTPTVGIMVKHLGCAGGVIDLRVGPIRDSLVAMAFVLQLMTQTGKTVSGLVGEIPRYCMMKQKFTADKKTSDSLVIAVKRLFPDAKLNTTDGCRFDLPDAWLHIRSSNTEPIVRVIAEAKDRAAARKYVDAVLNIQKKSAG